MLIEWERVKPQGHIHLRGRSLHAHHAHKQRDRTFKTGVRYSATPSAVPFILLMTSCIAMVEISS